MSHKRLTRDIQREIDRYRFARWDLLSTQFPEEAFHTAGERLIRRRQIRLQRHASGLEYALIPRRKAPSESSVVRSLTIHTAFQAAESSRQLLMRADFRRYFPAVFRPGLPQGYYIDLSQDRPTLGHVRVDIKPEPIRHILDRIQRLICRHHELSGFRSLIATHQFEITLLVATAAKSRILQQAMEPLSHSGVRLHAQHVPVLLDLLAPLSGEHSTSTIRHT